MLYGNLESGGLHGAIKLIWIHLLQMKTNEHELFGKGYLESGRLLCLWQGRQPRGFPKYNRIVVLAPFLVSARGPRVWQVAWQHALHLNSAAD